ncbi:hypothetical protein AY600_07945 [Phormidium willei BDU 130791]|nr:hypothetical protein AY600_07945 [Phormidium willei BDU 130791]
MHFPVVLGLLLLALAWPGGAPAAAQQAPLELVMFETATCPYCKQWHEEIGGIYPKTPEGRAAPLRRVDLDAPAPADLRDLQRSVVYTPTFVLLREGAEVGRIAGYPGEHFFWPLLANLLAEAGVAMN